MYALIALFDKQTEEIFNELWKELKDREISSYGFELKNRRPHITIADYDALKKKEFMGCMDKFYEGKQSVNVSLAILGTFMKSGTIFTAPALTRELQGFHKEYHEALMKFNDNEHSFYVPGRWVPHCTIASRLSEDNITKAFDYCSRKLKRIDTRITQLQLLEFQEFNEAGTCMSAPAIYTKKLL